MGSQEEDSLISGTHTDDNVDEKENSGLNLKRDRNCSLNDKMAEEVELLGESQNSSQLCRSLVNFDQNSFKARADYDVIDQALSRSSGYISRMTDDISFDLCSKEGYNQIKEPLLLSSSTSTDDTSTSCGKHSIQVQPNVHLKTDGHGRILLRTSSIPNMTDKVLIQPILMRYETSQSSDSIICRICHSCGDEKLIAPCRCSGSSRYVHASCLVTWFKKSVKHQCELCKSDVKIRKTTHKIRLWRKPEDRPVPLIWFSVFFIGLFLNIVSIYVNASEYCKSTACLIFYVVNGFGIILDAAFLWFWFLKCRHYWKKWCALNQDWFIDDRPSEADLQVQYVQGCPV